MNIKVTNFSLGDTTRNYLNEKLKHLNKFMDINSPNVILDVEIGRTTEHHHKGEIYKAEFNLNNSGEHYFAREESEDVLSSIDMAIDDLLKQLRRGKDKKETLFKRGGRQIKNMLRRFNPRG
jgi:ribosomal subunit interface protein